MNLAINSWSKSTASVKKRFGPLAGTAMNRAVSRFPDHWQKRFYKLPQTFRQIRGRVHRSMYGPGDDVEDRRQKTSSPATTEEAVESGGGRENFVVNGEAVADGSDNGENGPENPVWDDKSGSDN
jgi:hypothetical protein